MIEQFLQETTPCLDVRSCCEFRAGHLPRAHSFPLFTDEERAYIGTRYKREGKVPAILEGLSLVGPRLEQMAKDALALGSPAVRLYCFRGGMRSQSVAWLLQQVGLKTTCLAGGYKTFRRHVLELFTRSWPLMILGGLTGSGKTALLRRLGEHGVQIVDLEALACHRGSSFGGQNRPQPTQEYFENTLAMAFSALDPSAPILLEDESRMIGRCQIPPALFLQMRQAPLFRLERSRVERLDHLVTEYASIPSDELLSATQRLQKHLGGQRTVQIQALIAVGSHYEAADLLLEYYDKRYLHSLSQREKAISIGSEEALLSLLFRSAGREACSQVQ